MALRNAFEGIATELTLRRLLNAMNFAKDPQDRMRVVLENETNTNVRRISLWSWGTYAQRYLTDGSVNSVDPREPLAMQMRSNFNYVRNTRWRIT